MTDNTTDLKIAPITPAIGAVVEGVDLTKPMDSSTVAAIRKAWLDRGVLFFRNQTLDEAQIEAFIANFGKPITEPSSAAYGADTAGPPVRSGYTAPSKGATEFWHADATYLAEPPMGTALCMVEVPPVGGDTCWSNVTVAYEDLIEPLRTMLDKLSAVHWMIPSLEPLGIEPKTNTTQFVHPAVRIHPETGRRAIYVSEGWTRKIAELPATLSGHLLALVYDHIKSPVFTMRWRWAPGDVAFWDNRVVQHFAVPDYDSGRFFRRVVIAGDRPYGPLRNDA